LPARQSRYGDGAPLGIGAKPIKKDFSIIAFAPQDNNKHLLCLICS
jgi:hypothetical protein